MLNEAIPSLVSGIAGILSGEDIAYLPWDDRSDAAYLELAERVVAEMSGAPTPDAIATIVRSVCDSAEARADPRFEARIVRLTREIDAWLRSTDSPSKITRSIDACTLEEHLLTIFSTQNRLITAIEASHGTLSQSPYEWPQRGTLALDGKIWAFYRHGLGFQFESYVDGCVINAHNDVFTKPMPVDAWWVECYIDSLGIRMIVQDGTQVGVVEASITIILREFARTGRWIVSESAYGSPSFLPSYTSE